MSEFKKGQRVRVTEAYAKNINWDSKKNPLSEIGEVGTVTDNDNHYITIEFDNKEEFEGDYLFLDNELELV